MPVIFSIILSLYCFLLIAFLIGWIIIRRQSQPVRGEHVPGMSIVVAVRNEEENIDSLLKDISSLVYPYEKFEVLIVNDHSTDKTSEKVKAANIRNLILINLAENKSGKKSALQTAIEQSRFDIIVTTDADCRFSKNWLKCLSVYFDDAETKMLVGPVKLLRNNSFFSRLQVTEFISLVGTTGSAIGLGHPVMCNGANLAYRKETFNEVGGYAGNLQVASGDDEFLMRKIFSAHPHGIKFMNFYEGVVSSQPQNSIRNFFNQRLRWAGKWKHNTDTFTKLLAVFILFAQIAFVGLVVENSFHQDMTLIPVMLKLFLEGTFLFWVGRFLERRFDVLAFIVLQFLYPFYVIVTGAISLFSGYSWKNRNYK